MSLRICAVTAVVLAAAPWSSMQAMAADGKINATVVAPQSTAEVAVNIGQGDPSTAGGLWVFPGASTFPRIGVDRQDASPATTAALTRSDAAALRRAFPLIEVGSESLLEVAVSVRDDHGRLDSGDGTSVNEWTGMLDGAPAALTPPDRSAKGTPVDGWVSILD